MEQKNPPQTGVEAAARVASEDRAIAQRLFAVAAVAILAGTVSVLTAPSPPVQTGRAAPAIAASAGETDPRDVVAGPPPLAESNTVESMPTVEPDSEFQDRTPSGLEVKPMLASTPLTVRERTRVRADVDNASDAVGAINPGEPLRVIGAVLVGRDTERRESYWLQIRLDRGGVGYVQFQQAADLAAWRQAQAIARLRRQEEAAAAAEAASGIPLAPTMPADLFSGAPITAPRPGEAP